MNATVATLENISESDQPGGGDRVTISEGLIYLKPNESTRTEGVLVRRPLGD